MKQYVKTKHCRRKELLKLHIFAVITVLPNAIRIPVSQGAKADPASVKKRKLCAEQRKAVKSRLIQYYKSILIKLLNTRAHGDVKTLTNFNFMLGFSKHQVTQVLDNLDIIFSLSDVYNFVEIWDMRHALEIISVISDVCNDVRTDIQSIDPTPLEDNEYVISEEGRNNYFAGTGKTRPGLRADACRVERKGYIRGSVARGSHLGL